MTQEWSGNLSKNQLMERIGRYVCNKCGSGHSSDNMVPVCASCFHRVKTELSATETASEQHAKDAMQLAARVEELEKVRDALNRHNDRLNAVLQDAEARVVLEHEMYLDAHRDSMRAATMLVELRRRLDKLEGVRKPKRKYK